MLAKNDGKVRATATEDVKTPTGSSQLFFKRERAVSCPLTRSTSLTETEENREVMGPPLSRRVFIPDSMFNKDEYDLRDTGLPGFKELRTTSKKFNDSVKLNSTLNTEPTQLADCTGETECRNPRI